jgi:hypothetical protein
MSSDTTSKNAVITRTKALNVLLMGLDLLLATFRTALIFYEPWRASKNNGTRIFPSGDANPRWEKWQLPLV